MRATLYFFFLYYIFTGIFVLLAPEYLFTSLGLKNLAGVIWLAQLAGVLTAVFGVQFYWALKNPSAFLPFLKLAVLAQFVVPIVVLCGVYRTEIPAGLGYSFATFDTLLGLGLWRLVSRFEAGLSGTPSV